MSERPTPETDAVAAHEGNWDTKALRMSAHARNWERERDEAREAAEKWRKLHDTKDELFKKGIAEVERELDEARVLIKETERFADRFCQERDKARENATNYYAKIRELREDLEVLRSNKMGDPLLEITFRNLISERDELKCKIKELDQALRASAELLCFFFAQSGITQEDLKERMEAAK